eukprot:671960-Prorocentrum_lima.AAC.1
MPPQQQQQHQQQQLDIAALGEDAFYQLVEQCPVQQLLRMAKACGRAARDKHVKQSGACDF